MSHWSRNAGAKREAKNCCFYFKQKQKGKVILSQYCLCRKKKILEMNRLAQRKAKRTLCSNTEDKIVSTIITLSDGL